MGRRYYFGKEILLINYDEARNYHWSILIDRKKGNYKAKYHPDSPFKPMWSGLRAVVYNNENEIGLINWEDIPATEFYVPYRRIDSETESFCLPNPLLMKKI